MAAAIIYLEIRFAKMNEEKEDGIESTISVLEDIGATNIKHAENGWICFWLDDEVLWLNYAAAPFLQIYLHNTLDGCQNMEIAQGLASAMTGHLAGGSVTVEDGNIFIGWSSVLYGKEALEEGLPILISYLFQVREKYVSAYWKALAEESHNSSKPVS